MVYFPAAAVVSCRGPVRTLGGDTRLRRVGTDDIADLRELCATALRQGRVSGPLLWPESEWLRRVTDPEYFFIYRADDGVVVYGWHGSDLLVHFLWGATESTLRSLWAVVGSGSSVARTVHAYLSPDDPLFWLLPEEPGHEVEQHGWMLRILDVSGALTARGYPAGIDRAVTFSVDDGKGHGDAGTYRLTIGGGEGTVERMPAVGSDALRLTSRGLAALYVADRLRPSRLRGWGPAAILPRAELVDAVFATSTAYLTDYF